MIENLGDKANTNGFNKNPDHINRKGRQPSLKKQLAKVALSDGWLSFKPEDVQILEDGTVKLKVSTEEELALKLFEIATGKNPTAAMSAIKTYLETFDGKATQPIAADVNQVVRLPLGWSEEK